METESSDDFLRELARAPDRAPDPERIAHFRIVGRIGQGGMGVVYRADDEKLHRTIALKVLLPKEGNSEEQRQRFLREARAAARLTHPNIAVVHDVGEDAGIAYIAMELVAGASLRSVLQKGPLPLERAVPIALQIARGLACAHEANIVHRDLKPENVIIGKGDQVKIVDFGLAKQSVPADVEGFRTDEGRVLGTPAYMSPEQARGKNVTSASDIFAFGVMLYEMIAGRRPFVGESLVDLMVEVERGRKRSEEAFTPEVDGLLDRCLASDANERLSDGGHLVEAISSLSNMKAIVPKRRSALPFVIALGVLTLGVFAWIGLHKASVEPITATPRAPTMIEVPVPVTTTVMVPVFVPPSTTPSVVQPRKADVPPTKAIVLPSAVSSAPLKPRNDFDRQ